MTLTWLNFDVDQLSKLYDDSITQFIDQLIPARSAKIRKRASDPWFDQDCRNAKRLVRRFERHYRDLKYRSPLPLPTDVFEAFLQWKCSIQGYKRLIKEKRDCFWKNKIMSDICSSKHMWKSVDEIMARGKKSIPNGLTPEDFCDHFERKIDLITQQIDGSTSPSFSTCPPDCVLDVFEPVSIDTVHKMVLSLPNKSSYPSTC